MVCTKCKKDYSAERAKCPYCGTKNPVANVHNKNVKEFNYKYKKAVSTQTKKASSYKKRTLRTRYVAIASVILIAILAISFANYSKNNDNGIGYGKKHKAEISAQIERYIENKDYIGLGTYTDELGLVYTTTLTKVYSDYEHILSASLPYKRVFTYLKEGPNYYDLAAENISSFYRYSDADYLKITDENAKEALRIMRTCFEEELASATILSKEDISSFKYITKSQIRRALSGKVKR